ncbi:ubiquitin-related domain-containing protein [Pisolithus croceorrhizus]|nr:ubiquitin-related domain-containing protein [Pisolithus croceorrhizus]
MAGDRDTLLSMGFDPSRVDWALRATSHRGLQPAMDHLLEHEGEPIPDASASGGSSLASEITSQSTPAMDVDGDDDDAEALRHLIGKKGPVSAAATAGDVEAKSIRCSMCGKTFKNTALANYHAEKSGHDQFEESTEEIKPLTEEERKAKLAELQQKLVAKRTVKAQEEAKEAKANEAIKRKQGKDLNKIKEELKAKEMIKEAEQKRKEKADDAKARAAIKAQIEADKKARAEKAAREKALREGKPIVDGQSESNNTTSSSAAVTPSSSGVTGKDFKDTRLQIRLASGGTPYTTTLPSDSTLHDVAEFVAAQTLLVSVDTVSFTQQFPRKTFSRTDFNKSLRELGLTPSAVLIAS